MTDSSVEPTTDAASSGTLLSGGNSGQNGDSAPSAMALPEGTYTFPSVARRAAQNPPGPMSRWLLKGHIEEVEAPYEPEGHHHTHPWWKVMCLTGVDYFSTLGYQPGIAALAAGALSPIATLILVLLTIFGALPMYKRVAEESPHGDGSISMLEHLLTWWKGKLFVLCLIGFVATGFIITITLSAADATKHLVENPFLHFLQGNEVPITLLLISFLAAVFLKGFSEAIGIAVVIVVAYISLNLVVISRCIYEIATHPRFCCAGETRSSPPNRIRCSCWALRCCCFPSWRWAFRVLKPALW
jgi:hypothetical protein